MKKVCWHATKSNMIVNAEQFYYICRTLETSMMCFYQQMKRISQKENVINKECIEGIGSTKKIRNNKKITVEILEKNNEERIITGKIEAKRIRKAACHLFAK